MTTNLQQTGPKCCSCCCSKTGTFLIYLWVAVLSFTISAMQWIYQEPAFYDPFIYRPIPEDHFSHINNLSLLSRRNSSSNINSSPFFSSQHSSPSSFSHIIYFNRFNTTTIFEQQQPVTPGISTTSSEFVTSQKFFHTFKLFEMVTVKSNMSYNFEKDHFTSLIVQFHGYAEYSERYKFFYERFFSLSNSNNEESSILKTNTDFDNLSKNLSRIAIYSYDLRGHGYSSGKGRSFWRTSHEHLQDIETVICERIPFILHSVLKSPNAKVFLMAHSTSALNLLTFDYLKGGGVNSYQRHDLNDFSPTCSSSLSHGKTSSQSSTFHSSWDSNHFENTNSAESTRTTFGKFRPLLTLKKMIPNFSGMILTSPSIALKGFYNDFWSRRKSHSRYSSMGSHDSNGGTLENSSPALKSQHPQQPHYQPNESTSRNHLNIYSSSNREEVEAEHEVSSFFEMQIYLVKYLMLPLFPSLPIYPSFGALCLHPNCLQRYKEDKVMYKGPWKVGPWVSILEQMRNVVLYLRDHATSTEVKRKESSRHTCTKSDSSGNTCASTALSPPLSRVLVMHGQMDNLFEWTRTRALFENYFGNHMEWIAYENLGHDLFHEDDNVQIARDLYHFVTKS